MKILVRVLLCAGAGFLALALAGAVTTTDSSTVTAFLQNLQNDGFIAQEASFGGLNVLGLYDAGYLDSCFGNNPSTPYMIYWMPTAPGETYDHSQDLKIGKASGNEFLNKGLLSDFKLRPDEALVFIGRTPPPVTYFSFRSYLFSRVINGQRREIFASLGDPLNLRTIRTDGREGQPFGSRTIIITCADAGIDGRIRAAAHKAGYPPALVNSDIIPAPLVRMGLDNEADTFLVLLRLAFFKDKAAGSGYIADSGARVFRLTPKAPSASSPFPVQRLRVRGTGNTAELDLQPALDELRQAILKRYGELQAQELTTSIWLLEGFDAMQRGINVIGENRDTIYLRSMDFLLQDDPNEFLIVYGVNHAETGKALYNNFGIYGSKADNGIGAVSNLDFTGSATEFLPGHPQAKFLYVWKVSRQDHGDKHCLAVPWNRKSHGIDLDQKGFVGFRAYLEAATNTGPNWFELLYDRVIKFSR